MELTTIAVVSGLLFAFSLISRRVDGSVITAPLAFAAAGFVGSASYLDLIAINVEHQSIHLVAEVTLILVLFSDAARINLRNLRREHNLPVRMLGFGLPLTILTGTAFAAWMFPSFRIWEAALLAALLAPTDAALGQVVVSAQSIPLRIRQAINIESGLNDGIALPAVLMLATFSSLMMMDTDTGRWIQFAMLQVTLGPLTGVLVGHIGARLLDGAAARGWSSTPFEGIGTLSLAILSFILAEQIGGNGFISAFVAGAAFGHGLKVRSAFLFEFMDSQGQLLMLISFLAFGATLLPEGLHGITFTEIAYATLSLTIIRMLPIALSLLGSGIRWPSYLFLGWFGPRGIASILFLLLILEQEDIPHRSQIFSITVLTVAMSIVLHGISAAPLSRWYSRYVRRFAAHPEHRQVTDIHLRDGSLDPVDGA